MNKKANRNYPEQWRRSYGANWGSYRTGWRLRVRPGILEI